MNFIKKNWKRGDKLTVKELNRIETGIEELLDNVDDFYDTLDSNNNDNNIIKIYGSINQSNTYQIVLNESVNIKQLYDAEQDIILIIDHPDIGKCRYINTIKAYNNNYYKIGFACSGVYDTQTYIEGTILLSAPANNLIVNTGEYHY